MRTRGLALSLILALSFPLHAHSVEDPYPELSTGNELPGTRIWSTTETSFAEFMSNTYRIGWACPRHETPNGDPYAMDGNGQDPATGKWWRACFKNPWRVYDKAAWDKYYDDLRSAQEAAAAESRRWNEANPGRQKCVQWGPITDPYGGVSSGGVCANPVPAGTAPSGSGSVDAPSVGEGDVSGGSTSSPSTGSNGATPVANQPVNADSATSGSPTGTTSSPVVSGSSPDPTPSGGANYQGSGYPFTYIAEGQVGISGCPVGFQAANGLIVDVSAQRTYTECWPLRAWTANRLGGEAWELFKATGGTYDPTVEVERREKVALLKTKAKEVAESAAKQTPGIERCSSWSGFGESGRECAYAFIAPGTPSPVSSDPVSSSSQSPVSTSSEGVMVVTVTSSPGVSEPSSTQTESQGVVSETSSTSVAVGLETVSITGTSVQIARTALAVTSNRVEAQSISALAQGLAAIPTIIRSNLQSLPRDADLTYKVSSLTPQTCKASSFRVRITKAGLCEVEISITDSEGNNYEILKKIRRRG